MENFTDQELFLVWLGLLRVKAQAQEMIDRKFPQYVNVLWQERLAIVTSACQKAKAEIDRRQVPYNPVEVERWFP